ncbi:esterase family protein [Ophiostoma piceae UAMH 11346]|uniref:Esterase family protein n=1 Tax=Ophiostoma piceae (strain UAMH 11346) TaxID=1262450 RepID=S3C9F2_OPHP1|nr:esterase family protein [Ophiostoma piceae UAMH 11346]
MPRGSQQSTLSSLSVAIWLGLLLLVITPGQTSAVPAVSLAGTRKAGKLPAWADDIDNAGQTALGYDSKHDDQHDGFRWKSRGFASLGDSYSAGIGTHLDGDKEESCRLGYGAYPALLHHDLGLGMPSTTGGKSGKHDKHDKNITTFQWLSCTGSTTADVIASSASTASPWSRLWSWVSTWLGTSTITAAATPGQIDNLLTNPSDAALDFITLSIGGNDVGFFDVINACVFRFYGYYSGTCEAALLASEALIAQDDSLPDSFASHLTLILLQLLNRVRWEKHPRFRIVLTGYARFFNSETDICDTCSMSVWWHYGNATGTPTNATDTTYLTKGLRRRMNDLVTRTNDKLQKVVDNVNQHYAGAANVPRILFVNYDAAFDGHRFCEDGVMEPDYKRNDTWFFLVGGVDNDVGDGPGQSIRLDDYFATIDPASPLVDPAQCRVLADARKDWGERALCDLVQAQLADPSLLSTAKAAIAVDNDDSQDASIYGDGSLIGENSMWYVPTYYGKTFHPRSNGHKAIRDAVYSAWEEHGL